MPNRVDRPAAKCQDDPEGLKVVCKQQEEVSLPTYKD